MTTKVGINGFGRIGRLAFRRIAEVSNDLEVVAINDLTSPAMLAHLLKYDTAHGQFDAEISATENALVVNGKEIPVYAEADARNIPWVKNNGVDLVLESTGFYTSEEKASAHLEAGAKKVLISAPAGKVKTIVYGVNDDTLTADDKIVSAASCTTNCLAPLAKAVNDAFGIKAGTMTTIHAYTSDQVLLDHKHKDIRRARAAAMSMVPTTTGAAKAVALVIPSLKDKLTGYAVRVPVPTVSLTDVVFELNKNVTKEEINEAVKKASENELKGILEYAQEELVSVDYVGDRHSSIFDPFLTLVIDCNLVKVVSWYDNEYGYSHRVVDLAKYIADQE